MNYFNGDHVSLDSEADDKIYHKEIVNTSIYAISKNKILSMT